MSSTRIATWVKKSVRHYEDARLRPYLITNISDKDVGMFYCATRVAVYKRELYT